MLVRPGQKAGSIMVTWQSQSCVEAQPYISQYSIRYCCAGSSMQPCEGNTIVRVVKVTLLYQL